MIGYHITLTKLKNNIDNEDSKWRADAKKRTEAFKQAGKYDEDLTITNDQGNQIKASSIWSRIKTVYMDLQFDKCGYCERKLESPEFGKVEHDVEHYRPKKKAKPWNVPASLAQEGISLTSPAAGSHDPGYHLLSYHIFNYCISCKPCNSTLKKDLFPIEGPRDSLGDNPNQMDAENQLLLYPIGNIDSKPESLVDFHGVVPRPKPGVGGFKRRRALVTIVFFQLSNPKRKNLFRERATTIVSLHAFLQNRQQAGDVWDQLISTFTASSSPHANCARSFEKLFQDDQPEADNIFQLAVDFLNSISND